MGKLPMADEKSVRIPNFTGKNRKLSEFSEHQDTKNMILSIVCYGEIIGHPKIDRKISWD